MPPRDRMICLLLGVVELVCAALWCLGGAGVYGSPLAGLSGAQLARVWAFLLLGPLSVLPAALTLLWRRRLGDRDVRADPGPGPQRRHRTAGRPGAGAA